MSLPAEIREAAKGLVEACDQGSLASQALMCRDDVSPELGSLLTEMRGFMISIRAEAHNLHSLVGAAVMTGLVEREPVPQQQVLLELPAIAEMGRPTGRPPRHPAPDVSRLDLAAGERAGQ